MHRPESADYLGVHSSTHRKVIGYLGFFLPLVLAAGAVILFQTGIQSSISDYYHTKMGDVFVGALWAIAFGLFAYRGYRPTGQDRLSDNAVANLGCFFAIGVALVPTTPEWSLSKSVHLGLAALFFFVLIYFCLRLFPKTDQDVLPTKKGRRNTLYKACGRTMMVCIVLIGIYFLLPEAVQSRIEPYAPVFCLETIAVMCFGASWRFWCRQPTGIGDNEIWRIVKRNGILYLPDVGLKTTSFFSAFAGISASN